MPRRTAVAVAGAILAAALVACGTDSGDGPQASVPVRSGESAYDVVASGLDAPWSIVFHRSTPLVSERDSGRVVELDGEGRQREVTRIEGVRAVGEGGLLGLAVHDDHLYAYYTSDEDNRIDRFPIDGEPGALSVGAPQRVVDGIPAATNHNGGRIAFGPDGMLYVTTGDAGRPPASQDRASLAGKILRMMPDGQVPQDNPFGDSLVYSYGHRNAQGLAWAPDGTMFASEFGQNTWDELNVIRPGGNYGWPEVEGIGGRSGYLDPVQQWSTREASPSGITVHDGQVVIANLRGERLRRVPTADPATATESLTGRVGRIRDAVVAPDGSLWVLTNNTDGRGSPRPDDDRILRVGGD